MFEMNGDRWLIVLTPDEEMRKIEKVEEEEFLQGLTKYQENKIYINKECPNKKKTLIHELMHVYTYEYGLNPFRKKYDIEDLCEIAAASYDAIYKILEEVGEIE